MAVAAIRSARRCRKQFSPELRDFLVPIGKSENPIDKPACAS
jgi:hypothetical protein